MCLSTVYKENGGTQTKVCEYVSGVSADGLKITLTDILGMETVLYGTLKSVNLVDNKIIIEGAPEEQ